MKKFSLVSLFLLLSSIVISYSCSNELEDVGSTSAEGRMVTITTRSATAAEIEYPITLYAFRNSDGKFFKSVTINSSSDVQMLLPEGGYKIVAMAGTSGLTLPTNPSLTTNIPIPSDGLISSPLQIGRVDVSVNNVATNVDINMAYQVAKVNLLLTDIPENINSVSVSFSSMYESLTFNGSLSGSKTITMNLEKQSDGIWKAPTSYILPGESTQLTLSISMIDETSTNTYGYTHTTNLKAGTPYELVGSYKGEFIVSGTITSVGWAPTESIDFKFGPGAEEDNTGSDDTGGSDEDGEEGNEGEAGEGGNSDGIYMVDEIPGYETIWEGHFVVSNEKNDDGTYNLFLMSIKEYQIKKTEAANICASYVENGMSEWFIPTTEELNKILSQVVAEVSKTNNTLSTIEGDMVSSDNKYLCDSGDKYSMVGMSSTFLSTNPTDTYSLRLVKTVKVQLKSAGAQ